MSTTKSYKLNAQIAGSLWLVAIVVGILGLGFLGDYQQVETNLAFFSQHETNILIASLLALLMCFSTANIAISLYPVLKKYNESMALSAIGFRLIETVLFTVNSLLFLGLLTLSNEYVNSVSPDSSYQILGHTLYNLNEASGTLATFAFNLGAFMYCYIFFRTKLVPKELGALGIIAAVLGLLGAFFLFFEFYPSSSPISLVFDLPTLLFEILIGVWLIIKGFDQDALLALEQ